jgi:hypothetical protein
MTHNRPRGGWREGIMTAVAVGGFFIIVGIIFAVTPDLIGKIVDFFSNITTVPYPPDNPNSNFFLPAISNPAAHAGFYTAVGQFSLGIGILQAIILPLRIVYRSPTRRIAETVGNLIFWFGAAYLVFALLSLGTLQAWFQFWSVIIILVGVSVIVRALIHLGARRRK